VNLCRYCVAWGPGESSHHLVMCGTEDGAVCCWDLREPEEMHRAGGGGGSGGGFGKGAFSSGGGSGGEEGGEGGGAGGAEGEEVVPAIMKGRPFRRPSYRTAGG
jgi:hypothetical protein